MSKKRFKYLSPEYFDKISENMQKGLQKQLAVDIETVFKTNYGIPSWIKFTNVHDNVIVEIPNNLANIDYAETQKKVLALLYEKMGVVKGFSNGGPVYTLIDADLNANDWHKFYEKMHANSSGGASLATEIPLKAWWGIDMQTQPGLKEKEENMVAKKSGKSKPNQLSKSIGRISKITAFSALAKRSGNWAKLENDPTLKAQVTAIHQMSVKAAELQEEILTAVKFLESKHYAPPKKSSSGELKFELGRQVFIKPKYIETYKEGGWSDEVLGNLFINSVVKGRVFLSVGKPDPNGAPTGIPPIAVPKIHVASAPTNGG